MIIPVTKINQCGDHFIFTFYCPSCGIRHFETNDSRKEKLCKCSRAMADFVFDISGHKFHLVTGTKRKCRFSIKKIRLMYDMQEGKCAYCCISLNLNYHIEHIVPLAAGGTNADSNLCISCPRCNLLAGSKVFSSFIDKQKYILMAKKLKIFN